MAQPIPNQCPLSGGPLEVTEVTCLDCGVQIRGHFTLNPYDQIAPEQRQFLEAFLRCRGLIRDVEAALGISYPTVRARLDSLLTALGFDEAGPEAVQSAKAPHEQTKAGRRREILAAIGAGAMSAEDGLRALKDL